MTPTRFIGRHRAVEPLLANVPPSWEIRRFKSVLERSNARNEDLSAPMMSLKSTGDVVHRSSLGQNQEPDDASLPRYLVTDVNELVVNPMWLVGGAIGVAAVRGAVSPDYRVFTPCSEVAPRYLHYVVRSQPYIDQYLLYTRAQTTFDRRVQQPDLDNLPLPVPPVDEQRAIADYLDRETARIDTLIEEQHRLIEMLLGRRTDWIRSAVLGDINPFAPPTDVRLAAVGHHFTVTLGKMLDAGKSSRDGDLSLPYIRAGNIQDSGLRLADVNTMPYSPGEAAELNLLAGDLLVAEGGAVGTNVVVHEDMPGWSFQKTVNRLRAKNDWSSTWLGYLLRTYRDIGVIEIVCNKSTISHLTAEKLRALRVPNCAPAEQRRIAAYLDEQTAKIDTLIVETEKFIELAWERRSALITAAVTGQIDVTGRAG